MRIPCVGAGINMRVSLNEESQAIWQQQNLEHLRYEYELKPDDLVVDIGAYRGEWAAEIFKRYGCRLIVIEPGPWIVGFPHGEVINKAASDHDGTVKFGGSYYYTSEHEEPTHEYECFDINSLLEVLPEIALVKMNVEGAEYALLDHMITHGYHSRIRNLQVQFHLIEQEPYAEWYSGIEGRLRETHKVEWRWPFCWENWRRK